MKKILIATLFLFPSFALANSVQIYPTIMNAHGGTLSAADITVCWRVNGFKSCSKGVPTFEAPVGSTYEVVISPPQRYSYITRGECKGTVAGNEASVVCFVDYKDGAPAVEQPVPVLQSPAPSVGGEVDDPVLQVPKSGLTSKQVDAIIGLLRAFNVDETVVMVVESILR